MSNDEGRLDMHESPRCLDNDDAATAVAGSEPVRARDEAAESFEVFLGSNATRLRRALFVRYGVDVGAEATQDATSCDPSTAKTVVVSTYTDAIAHLVRSIP